MSQGNRPKSSNCDVVAHQEGPSVHVWSFFGCFPEVRYLAWRQLSQFPRHSVHSIIVVGSIINLCSIGFQETEKAWSIVFSRSLQNWVESFLMEPRASILNYAQARSLVMSTALSKLVFHPIMGRMFPSISHFLRRNNATNCYTDSVRVIGSRSFCKSWLQQYLRTLYPDLRLGSAVRNYTLKITLHLAQVWDKRHYPLERFPLASSWRVNPICRSNSCKYMCLTVLPLFFQSIILHQNWLVLCLLILLSIPRYQALDMKRLNCGVKLRALLEEKRIWEGAHNNYLRLNSVRTGIFGNPCIPPRYLAVPLLPDQARTNQQSRRLV